jgi:hypothetical protein
MDSFEQLFAKAEIHGLIEQNIVSDKLSIAVKRQSLNLMREYDITQYCIEFRTYLNEKNNISFVADNDFSQYCKEETTFDLFVEFIHYRKAETKKNIAENAQKTATIARYSEQQLIAMDILGITTGENNFNPVQPVFYHIDEVLIKHNLTPKQAEKILKNYTGGLTPTTNKSLTKKVRKHLKWLVKYDTETPPQPNETGAEQESISAKFYALYHWILIEMGKEIPFEKNDLDKYNKNTIENFGKNRYNCSKQGFYRAFIDIDITNKASIPKSFGKEYKQTLITISNNDSNIITHLKKYPK